MKTMILGGIITLMVDAVVPCKSIAQGAITYLSNLSQSSSGSASVGSNSWYAADFITGTNTGGYILDSIQLALLNAIGNPSGFSVMIYTDVGTVGALPGSSIGTLSGSLDPVTQGIYTYTATSALILQPHSTYYVVLNGGTMASDDAYEWSVTGTPSTGYTSNHWGGEVTFLQSSDGTDWNNDSGSYGQFALEATPTPEPSSEILLGLCGLGLFLFRWRSKAVL